MNRQGLHLVLALAFTTAATAIEPEDVLAYRIGNVSVRPNFGIAQSYNDNVFFRGDDTLFRVNPDGSVTPIERVGDHITSLSGGASLILGRPTSNMVAGNYSYSHRLFHEYDVQNAGGHTVSLQGQVEGARINLTPSISYSNVRSLLAGGGGGSVALREALIERNNFQSRITSRIRLTPKTFTHSTFVYNLNDYKGVLPLFDTDDMSIRQGVGFQFRPKIDLSLTGTLGRRTASQNSVALGSSASQNYYGGGIRAEGEFSERLTGEASFGLQHTTFSGAGDSFNAPVVTVALEYLMGRDFLADISYTRQTFIGIQSANASGVADRIRLTMSKPFGKRKNWVARASGNMNFQTWENRTGPSGNRSDDWLSGTLSIQYRIQEWLSSSFSYSLQSFASSLSRAGTFGIVDYDVNTVSLSLRVGY